MLYVQPVVLTSKLYVRGAYTTCLQISGLSPELDTIIIDPVAAVIAQYTGYCTSARCRTIVYKNHTIASAGPDGQYIGAPYSTYAGGKESQFRNHLLLPMTRHNPIVKLMCGHILQHMIPVVKSVMSQGIHVYIDRQHDVLIDYFKVCESNSSSSNSSSSNAQDPKALATAQAEQKAWATLYQRLQAALNEFKTDTVLHARAYMNDTFKIWILELILDTLRNLRDKALRIKRSRRKHCTVNAVRVNLFIAKADSIANMICKIAVKLVRDYCRVHVKDKLLNAILAALLGHSNWLSQQHNTMTTTLDANYSEACKQLQQFVDLDTVQSRSGFKYATTANIPLVIDKLKAVYSGDDADFLTSVLNKASIDNVSDGSTTTTAATGSSSNSSSNNDNESNSSSSSSSSSTQLKRKHSAVDSSTTEHDIGETDDDAS
jgi:hypothetical protein